MGPVPTADNIAATPMTLIPLTVPEVRRLLVRLVWPTLPRAEDVLAWSHWRRRHQAVARRCHYRRRNALPS